MFCEGFQMAMPAPLKPLLYRLVLNSPLKSAIHFDYIIKDFKTQQSYSENCTITKCINSCI